MKIDKYLIITIIMLLSVLGYCAYPHFESELMYEIWVETRSGGDEKRDISSTVKRIIPIKSDEETAENVLIESGFILIDKESTEQCSFYTKFARLMPSLFRGRIDVIVCYEDHKVKSIKSYYYYLSM